MTVHEHVAHARERLRAAGIPNAEADLDARLLAEHVLGWDATRYFTDGQEPAPPSFPADFESLVHRRAAREPVAYIVGRQEFWDLTFEVAPGVLIPRPESELVVEAALEAFPDRDSSLQIADVCTGSGCIAVALAVERPRAHVVAVDVSADAVSIARANVARHGVADRVALRQADLLAGVEGPFDLVTANPPYVRACEKTMLQPEVVAHEPSVALFGGPDGLDVIGRLVPQASERLRPGGWLIFEFGFGQDEDIERLISTTPGLTIVQLRPDLQGIPRTAIARRA